MRVYKSCHLYMVKQVELVDDEGGEENGRKIVGRFFTREEQYIMHCKKRNDSQFQS